MSETFETSSQASLPLIPNATSSPVLEDGPSLSGLQAGQIAAPCGPDPARANLSARRATERGLLTSGTYGRPGSISSTSATLQRSLVNRLKQQLNTDGSTLFKMTWKESITPSLRWACLLRARARNTTGLDDGSLPTPSGTSNHGKNHVNGTLQEWGGSSNPFRGTEIGSVRCASFELWMMGYGTEWKRQMPLGTLSSPRSRRNSLKAI
jgi:hypothetical protein